MGGDFVYRRTVPRTTLSRRDALIVAPDSPALAPTVAALRVHLRQLTGEDIDILPGSSITDDHYHTHHLIVIGHLANNPVMRRLYTARYSFIDAGYPGGDGYVVKSLIDPFGTGRNVILAGGSTDAGLIAACEQLAAAISQPGADLDRLHAIHAAFHIPDPPAAAEVDRLVAEAVATWQVGWTSSPIPTATTYGLYYFLSDRPAWAELFARIMVGSIRAWADLPDDAKAQYVFFNLHHLIHLWDLIEPSPCFRDDDRAHIAGLLLTFLHHLAHSSYFWPGAIPDGEIRQNHLTFLGLALFYGWRYFTRRHGSDVLAYCMPDVERTFTGQARSYKANDAAGCGYAWIVPRLTAHYWLARDADYIRATPQFHNTVIIVHDGESHSPPPLASLVHAEDAGQIGLMQTEAAPYNGMVWRRNIIWRKGAYLLVVDELTAQTTGEFVVECLWRLLGQVVLQDGGTLVHQDGVTLAILSADESRKSVIEEETRKSSWAAYEHADGVVRVLHQRIVRSLERDERIAFANLFCMADGDGLPYTVERPDEQTVRIRKKGKGKRHTGTVDLIRLGEPAGMPGMAVHGVGLVVREERPAARTRRQGAGQGMEQIATVSLGAPICTFSGIPSVGLVVGTTAGDVACIGPDGAVIRQVRLEDHPVSLHVADIDGDGHLETLIGTDRARLLVLDAQGAVRWERLCDAFFGRETKVTAITTGRDTSGAAVIYAGTAGWHVYRFDETGKERWRRQIKYHAVTALLAADLDGDGREEVAVGEHGHLHRFDAAGRRRWYQSVGARLAAVAVTDLNGDGHAEIIGGTPDGRVVVYDGTGRVMATHALPGAVTALSAGRAGSVDVFTGDTVTRLEVYR